MPVTSRTLSGCRILVAEDEFLVAEELRDELDEAGAMVLGPVARLVDALDLIQRETRIDGAILDVNLQGETIFTAADLLTERGVPFVFTTGYDISAIPKRFAHVVRCEKPADMSAVLVAIGRMTHA